MRKPTAKKLKVKFCPASAEPIVKARQSMPTSLVAVCEALQGQS
jgi:hypothetical protein